MGSSSSSPSSSSFHPTAGSGVILRSLPSQGEQLVCLFSFGVCVFFLFWGGLEVLLSRAHVFSDAATDPTVSHLADLDLDADGNSAEADEEAA